MPARASHLSTRRRRRRHLRAAAVALAAGALLPLRLAPTSAAQSEAGHVFAFGAAPYAGGAGGEPATGMARTPTGRGYWLAGARGGVFAFGDATFHGALPRAAGRPPVVDMVAAPDGKGYWLAAGDGGVFAFGDAVYAGSAAEVPLNSPVVAMAATTTGKGYWLAARDGGVFAFGDAAYAGSGAGKAGSEPMVDMAASPDGKGYWLAGADGGVFAFGSAPFHGSAGAIATGAPVTAMEATPAGDGVWLTTGGRLLGDYGVTCYSLRGITATGAPVSERVVAVDPREIALHSEIFVSGVGTRRALDTGSAVQGRRLDVWHPSSEWCREFGHRTLSAYVMAEPTAT